MELRDTLTLDAPSIRKTRDGYLVASVRAARTGIQEYAGWEVGKPAMDRVRVYRSEAEVFSKDAMASFTSLPITVEHPDSPITADNWRDHSVGNTGEDIARDGEFIRVPIIVKDASAISEIENGRRELSMGYATDLAWTPGTTPDGLTYDAIQTNLRGNHLAIVSAARGGPELKIGDTDMTTRTITVDGIKLTLEDQSAAIVEKTINAMSDAKSEAEKKAEDMEEEMKKSKKSADAKDAEIATLKSQLADATDQTKLDAAIKDRSDAIDKAKVLIGDKLVIDGKSTAEIRKQVVDAKLGDAAKDWSEDQVAASFGTLTATVKTGDRLATALSKPGSASDAMSAYDAYKKRTSEAWKTAGVTA